MEGWQEQGGQEGSMVKAWCGSCTATDAAGSSHEGGKGAEEGCQPSVQAEEVPTVSPRLTDPPLVTPAASPVTVSNWRSAPGLPAQNNNLKKNQTGQDNYLKIPQKS